MSASVPDIVITTAMVALALVFLVLETHAVRSESGLRRWVAIIPAMVVGWIALGILLSPEAHSLWPLELVLWLIPAILVLLFLRFSSGRARTGT
jgi:hypothetical protein